MWFLLAWLAPFLAQGFAFQLDAVRVVNQAIQDAVGDGRITNLLMPVRVVGLEGGKELENRLQFAGAVLKAHLEYDRDLVMFEQVEVQDKGVAKLCVITVIAQACGVVGVTDGQGHFTYPVRLQTGRLLGTRIEAGSRKTHFKSDNFDFVEELLQFVRDHGPTG